MVTQSLRSRPIEQQQLLDRPPEPVIGPAKGRTRWRAMTAERWAMTAEHVAFHSILVPDSRATSRHTNVFHTRVIASLRRLQLIGSLPSFTPILNTGPENNSNLGRSVTGGLTINHGTIHVEPIVGYLGLSDWEY